MKLQPGRSWRFTQAIADFCTVFIAAFGSYWVYIASGFGRSDFNPELYARIDLTIAALTTFAMHAYGAYGGHLGLLRIESARRVLRAVFAGIFLMFAASYFLQSVGFSRIHMLLAGPFMAFGLLAQRVTLWRMQAALRARSGRQIPVLVYGAGTTGRVLAQQLLDEHAIGLEPVGFLDDSPALKQTTVRVGPGVQGVRLPVFGGGDELEEVLLLSGANAVFLATPSAPSSHTADIVARLERLGVPFYGVPSSGDMVLSTLSFGQIGSIPVFTRRAAAHDPFLTAVKRLIDLLGAAALLAVTLPVLVIAAIAVRATSTGPVFFRQTRIGLAGKPFTIFKLRTMDVDTPVYAEHPRSGGDPRVTPIGRLLRRTCIDELPQLWNVLRGEMSLVGPRPEMPQIVAGYSDLERQRLAAKPGVTGLWQISADRAFRIHDNMHYDLYYIEHRTLSMDLAILLMTPFMMMRRNRAV